MGDLWGRLFLGGLAASGPTRLLGFGGISVFAVLRLAVSPLRRVTFSRRRKGNRKGLLLRSALAGSGSFAAGSIRAQRLRFASLHLLPLCLAAPDGRCAPTPGSIPPLSLPTSPVDQDQKHSSLRSLLSGAALPRAAALLCFCGSEPAREGGLTADLFLSGTRSNCRSCRRLRSFDLAFALASALALDLAVAFDLAFDLAF